MHHTLLLAILSQNGNVSQCPSESQLFSLPLNTARGSGVRRQALEVWWCLLGLCCHWRCHAAIASLPSLHRRLSGHQHNLPSAVPTQRPPAPAAAAQPAAPAAVAGRPPPDAFPPQRLRQVPHQTQDVERVIPG